MPPGLLPAEIPMPRAATRLTAAIALCAALYALLFAQMTAGSAGPFTLDESVYFAMADSMAERGALAIQDDGGVPGAPALRFALSDYGADGRVYPQYPSGYAIIAAPFYKIFGVWGLYILNALAGLVCISLVYRIALRLYQSNEIALWSGGLFAGATFFPTYAFAIWPHVLTLALLLGGAACALTGAERHRFHYGRLAAAGALIAAAVTVRVDSILFFAPVYVWLRLFAAPSQRMTIIALGAGAAPVLALAAYLNFLKFGSMSPVTYGARTGYESLDAYAPAIIAVAVTAAILFAVDISRLHRASQRPPVRRRWIAAAIAAVGAIILLQQPAARLLHNLWTLLFDIQTFDGSFVHDSLSRDDGGYLTTNGLPKKALFQSMPFFMLALLALGDIASGTRRREIAFCALFIATPILFFGIRQWHGGHSFNMRFLLPAVPFLTIVASASLVALMRATNADRRLVPGLIVAGAVGAALIQITAATAAPNFRVPAATYPQLILSLAIAAGSLVMIVRDSAKIRGPLLWAAGLSIGAAAFSNFSDFDLTRQGRARSGVTNAYFAATIPPKSLIISFSQTNLVATYVNGVNLLHPYADEFPRLGPAIGAFDRAGRCVYIRKGSIADYIANSLSIPLEDASPQSPDERAWFMTLAPLRPGCALR